MPVLLIRHKVANYDTWRQVFLEEASTRQANGARTARIFHNAENPGEVWVLHEWDDLFRARLYVRSDELGDAIARSGAVDAPDFWYLDDGDRA